MQDLSKEIRELIYYLNEGVYWDFKREPHENNAKLLHDILCLANANHDGDRYLIIGVSDPSEGCEIIGFNDSTPNRKKQSDLIDFLRNKSFAGHIRPSINLQTIEVDFIEIDVIIIKQSDRKPFYLTEDYRDRDSVVKANYIYSREGDTNTPIDTSADINEIERMWRERLGLIENPTDKFKTLLFDLDNWEFDIGNKKYGYHKQFPEYRFEIGGWKEIRETYSYYFINKKSYMAHIHLKYHSTILFEHELIFLDEMRVVISLPEVSSVGLNYTNRYYFWYYTHDSIGGRLQYLVTNDGNDTVSRGSFFPFFYFQNNAHKDEFEDYVLDNYNRLPEIEVGPKHKLADESIPNSKRVGTDNPIKIGQLEALYEEFISP